MRIKNQICNHCKDAILDKRDAVKIECGIIHNKIWYEHLKQTIFYHLECWEAIQAEALVMREIIKSTGKEIIDIVKA